MKPTIEILNNLQKNSSKNHDEKFTKLYRYLLRPDIYYIAYQHLYANNGADTKGINDDTIDGFSIDYVDEIIQKLREECYEPTPVRRTYIKKSSGKMRPLGIPTFSDKLVQEVMRMILESVYEPIFSNNSHGFRTGRSCHTALAQIKHDFVGAKWFIEGDIKGCFDNISHEVLLKVLGEKIKDARFLHLIAKFLKAGYIEDWKYNNTYSGCPQGGIISPILANIYLNELDKFVEEIKTDFDNKTPYTLTPQYTKLMRKRAQIKRKVDRREKDAPDRNNLIAEYKEVGKLLRQTPAKDCNDKKIKYVRYADDFIVAVNGNKEDCENIKAKLTEFISSVLKMELSQEKTLITHSNEKAKFLGYDIRVRRDQTVKPWKNVKQRTLNNTVELLIPLERKINSFLFDKGIIAQGKDGKIKPIARKSLTRNTDLEIVMTFDAELRGICNYYFLASNYRMLNFFSYLMEYSCLKTLAWKHRCKLSAIYDKYRAGQKRWGIPYMTKAGKKIKYLTKFNEIDGKKCEDVKPAIVGIIAKSRTTIDKRLMANCCELCGCTNSKKYEVHHVNKVKNLKGKEPWEIVMIAKKRKTIIVCHDCHMKIHHGNKTKSETK